MRVRLSYIMFSAFIFLLNIGLAHPIEYHLVISEVYPSLYNPNSVFIELYNPLQYKIDISKFTIKTYTSSKNNITYTIPSGASIPAHGFYLIMFKVSNPKYAWPDNWPEPDLIVGGTLDHNSDGIILSDRSNNKVDVVGWGIVIPPNFYEECPIDTSTPTQSMERKSGPTHNEKDGNAWDTDNNYEDFRYRDTPEPQNTKSPTEDPKGQVNDDSIGIIKAFFGVKT
ncbi:MAG: lamin tail domain-containing protein [bacterium]